MSNYDGSPLPIRVCWNEKNYESVKPVLFRDLLTLKGIYSRGINFIASEELLTQCAEVLKYVGIENTSTSGAEDTPVLAYYVESLDELKLPETSGEVISKRVGVLTEVVDETLDLDDKAPHYLRPNRVFPDPRSNPLARPMPAPLPTRITPY